jgi:hypothetical protein
MEKQCSIMSGPWIHTEQGEYSQKPKHWLLSLEKGGTGDFKTPTQTIPRAMKSLRKDPSGSHMAGGGGSGEILFLAICRIFKASHTRCSRKVSAVLSSVL